MTQHPITAVLKERISSLLAAHSYDDDTLLTDITTAFSQAIGELEQKVETLSKIVGSQSDGTSAESNATDMQPTNFVNAHEFPEIWVQGTDKSQSALELVAEACGASPGRGQQIRLVITPSLHVFVSDTFIGNLAKYSITMQKYLEHGSVETIGKLVYSRGKRRWYVALGTE